jgi:2-phosphosulfolactate phosphatase
VAGVEGARRARGTVVIIDVLRAFTVSSYALSEGAVDCLLVGTIGEALELQRAIPGSLVSAEVDGLPVPGVPISNSPSQVLQAELAGRTLVQRTSAGTQCALAAAASADYMLVAALTVAAATVRHLLWLRANEVTLVASGASDGHLEDRACADYLEALLTGAEVRLEDLLGPLRVSERFRQIAAGEVPGFPPHDLQLALSYADRFDFAMEAEPWRGSEAAAEPPPLRVRRVQLPAAAPPP